MELPLSKTCARVVGGRILLWNGLLAATLMSLGACAQRDDARPRRDESAGSKISATSSATFTTFESGQVRPLALSPDGRLLFAVNTPDNRLEVFKVRPGGLTRQRHRRRVGSAHHFVVLARVARQGLRGEERQNRA
jgi:hypothetical protein